MKRTLSLTGIIILILFAYSAVTEIKDNSSFVVRMQELVSNVFLATAVTDRELHLAYEGAREGRDRVRVLIVPGHTPENPGALYKGNPEWKLNIKMALILKNYLNNDKHFQVFITQDLNGVTEEFQNYFNNNRDTIISFIDEKKRAMSYLLERGVVNANQTVERVTVSETVATELYGINKWANDNDIDIVLHLHFNDYPGRYRDSAPQHSGFSLYIPEKQYTNGNVSRALASRLFMSLSGYYATSDLPSEEEVIIEDQELIAVGAFNTLESAVTLIEYGYLYEPQFFYKGTQIPVLHDLAYQTYRGLKSYFEDEQVIQSLPDTILLPYTWERDIRFGEKGREDILALQAYLTKEGMYPPYGKSRNECPLSGIFGFCTQEALKAFQEARDIQPASGFFGSQTRALLNGER